ncbi:MAG: class I SAM-dependent methyltransferase [Pseudomonadota bacterium]
MAHSARFWDWIAPRYARSKISNTEEFDRKRQMTSHHLTAKDRVLELGCGTGTIALIHAPEVAEILATDISETMLDIARRKAEEAGVQNVTFTQADIDLIGEEAQFDAALAFSLLHLLEDRDRAIGKVFRLVRPGGLFISTTFCMADRLWWVGLIAPIGRALGLLPLIRLFRREDLERSITDAGFEIVETWQPSPKKPVFFIARRPAAA